MFDKQIASLEDKGGLDGFKGYKLVGLNKKGKKR